MQIKKDEVRLKILEAATDEFLKRGYENASMRMIAQKAHTTMGNIYHYFRNKEILLETIVLPTIENIESMIKEHVNLEKKGHLTKEEGMRYLEQLETRFEESGLMCFFDRRVIIILQLNSSALLERKEKILQIMLGHLNWHFQLSDDFHYSEMLLNFLVECVRHVLIEHENLEDAKAEFMQFLRLACTGILGQMK